MNLLTTPDFSHGLLDLFDPPGLHDPSANGYSHVAVVRLPARVIHIAGQGGEDDQGSLSPSFEEQVSQALDNLQTALRSAHADLTDVARLRILVRRCLQRWKYPPDQQPEAVELVLKQAESLSNEWSK